MDYGDPVAYGQKTAVRPWKRIKKVAIKPLPPVLTVLLLDLCSPTHHSPSWL